MYYYYVNKIFICVDVTIFGGDITENIDAKRRESQVTTAHLSDQ